MGAASRIPAIEAALQRAGWVHVPPRARERWHLPGTTWYAKVGYHQTFLFRLVQGRAQSIRPLDSAALAAGTLQPPGAMEEA